MTSGPQKAAIATLRRCQQGLATCATEAEREQLLALNEQALQLLEQSAQHPSTRQLVARVADLEVKLAHLPASERVAAIRARLSLSKTWYYQLRKLAQSA